MATCKGLKRHEFSEEYAVYQKKIVTLRLYNNNFKISDMKSICAFIASILACVLSASAEIPEKAIPFILDSHVYIQGVVADTIGTLPNFRGKAKRMSNKTEMITVI